MSRVWLTAFALSVEDENEDQQEDEQENGGAHRPTSDYSHRDVLWNEGERRRWWEKQLTWRIDIVPCSGTLCSSKLSTRQKVFINCQGHRGTSGANRIWVSASWPLTWNLPLSWSQKHFPCPKTHDLRLCMGFTTHRSPPAWWSWCRGRTSSRPCSCRWTGSPTPSRCWWWGWRGRRRPRPTRLALLHRVPLQKRPLLLLPHVLLPRPHLQRTHRGCIRLCNYNHFVLCLLFANQHFYRWCPEPGCWQWLHGGLHLFILPLASNWICLLLTMSNYSFKNRPIALFLKTY